MNAKCDHHKEGYRLESSPKAEATGENFLESVKRVSLIFFSTMENTTGAGGKILPLDYVTSLLMLFIWRYVCMQFGSYMHVIRTCGIQRKLSVSVHIFLLVGDRVS